jgi:O-antigen/teichoic acid export membrane protein
MIKRLVFNMSSNMMQFIVYIVTTFLMAPFYLGMLGLYDYGLREMVLSIIGYMGMLDMGMSPTVSRFTAMHNARGERQSVLIIYATSMVFMGIVGCLMGGVFWLWALLYPELLMPENSDNTEKYVLFLLIIGVQLVFTFPRVVVESLLEGLQRYYLKNLVNMVSTIMLAVLSYLYMTPENALTLFTSLTAGFIVVRLLILMVMLRSSEIGIILPNLRLFSMNKLREMLSFGIKSFIQGAAATIQNMSDRLVIGVIMGPVSVPVYSISQTLVSSSKSITMILTHVFMPLFSDLSPRGDQHKIRKIFMLASKLVVGLIAIPMGASIYLLGAPFIHIWMDGVFDQGTVETIIAFLSIYTVLSNLNPFASRYLTAINKHGILARLSPFTALTNLILSIVFVMMYGLIGAALGSIFAIFIVTPIVLIHVCRHLDVEVKEYITRCILPSLLPVILMSVLIIWLRVTWGIHDYYDILIILFAGGAVYAITFWVHALDRNERAWLIKNAMDVLRRN